MPWRKYKTTTGKHGDIYKISKGIQVRQDDRAKWTIYINCSGQRTNKTIGEGREGLVQAIKAAEAIADQLTSKPLPEFAAVKESDVPKFEEYSNQWFQNKSGGWSIYTQSRYSEVLRLHIWPDKVFKDKRLDEITRQTLKDFYSRLFRKLSAATVETAHSIINGVFDEAIDDEIVKACPATGLLKKVLPPHKKRNKKEADPFDAEERKRFAEILKKKYSLCVQLIFKVMLYGGFRLGEVLAMRLRYLDLVKMTYLVSESYKRYRFGKPKKGKKRLVDLPTFLIEDLKQYILNLKKESLQKGNGGEVDLLFQDPAERNGWPYSQGKIGRLLKKICTAAELRVRNPHDLRHTYATTLLMAHQSPAYVQKQMGHESIQTTVDTYGHWIPGDGRKGLDEALFVSVPNSGENCTFLHMEK
ncbi:MAG: site-specific integrase [Pseudomonadota bacterium]